jgi:hypothetical protein
MRASRLGSESWFEIRAIVLKSFPFYATSRELPFNYLVRMPDSFV